MKERERKEKTIGKGERKGFFSLFLFFVFNSRNIDRFQVLNHRENTFPINNNVLPVVLRKNKVELIVPELDKTLAKQSFWHPEEGARKYKKDPLHGSQQLDTNEANPHHKLVKEVDFPPCLFSQISINFKCSMDRCTESPYCFDIALESFQAASWYSP